MYQKAQGERRPRFPADDRLLHVPHGSSSPLWHSICFIFIFIDLWINFVNYQVPYAIALAKAVEPYKIKWIEEFLPPDDYDGYSQVKKGKGAPSPSTSARAPPLIGVSLNDDANGGPYRRGLLLVDHGRARVHALRLPRTHRKVRTNPSRCVRLRLASWCNGGVCVWPCRRCVDILQPDITWVGGLTEAKKIYSMAAAYDIPGEHPRPHSIPSHMWAAAHRVT